MSLYDRIAARPGGPRLLAAARLRRDVGVAFHEALERSGLSYRDLAERLGKRPYVVRRAFEGDFELSITQVSEYLHAMGYTVRLTVTPTDDDAPLARRTEQDGGIPNDTRDETANG